MRPSRHAVTESGVYRTTVAAGSGQVGLSAAADEMCLVRRVWNRCHRWIVEACACSSVPPAFFGALTAGESGGDPRATRFEPSVYARLKAMAEGRAAAFGSIRATDLAAEVADMRSAKAPAFHAHFLDEPFTTASVAGLARAEDEALRELATSWGLTQIMGYHMAGRAGTVRDLLDPAFHYRTALALLAEFAERYQLDLTREFEELFRCWNTGRPYGRTFAPDYAAAGVRRMEIYRALAGAS